MFLQTSLTFSKKFFLQEILFSFFSKTLPKHSLLCKIYAIFRRSIKMASSLNIFSNIFNSNSLLINITTILIIFCVCAHAGNSNAASSTSKHHHKWVGPSGHRLITVDANGLGEFPTVQAAVDAVPHNNTKNVLILISAGSYMYVMELKYFYKVSFALVDRIKDLTCFALNDIILLLLIRYPWIFLAILSLDTF